MVTCCLRGFSLHFKLFVRNGYLFYCIFFSLLWIDLLFLRRVFITLPILRSGDMWVSNETFQLKTMRPWSGRKMVPRQPFMQVAREGSERGVRLTFQLLMLSPNLLKSKIPYAQLGVGRGLTLQRLILGPNLLKSKSPCVKLGDIWC